MAGSREVCPTSSQAHDLPVQVLKIISPFDLQYAVGWPPPATSSKFIELDDEKVMVERDRRMAGETFDEALEHDRRHVIL